MRLLAPWGLVLSAAAFAADSGQVQALREEATAILQTYHKDNKAVSVEEYAAAVLKLEQAVLILEKAGDTESALMQEISAQYFWAKRMAKMAQINAINALRAKGGFPPPTRFASAGASVAGAAPEAVLDLQAQAKQEFDQALAYAEQKKGDEMAVAKRFFLVAGLYPGTDYGTKAMGLAREALLRFANQGGAAAEQLPDTPEMEKVKRGDELAALGKFREALPLYNLATRGEHAVVAFRHQGRAYFAYAQALREQILAEWEDLKPKVEQARKNSYTLNGGVRVFDPNHPQWQAAQQAMAKLTQRAQEAKTNFSHAQRAFEQVLRLSKDQKDLEAACHIALCLRGSERVPQAKSQMEKIIKEYEPSGDYERILYEYCKMEAEALGQK